MPPASLSTLAVMKPGPMTARNINRRIRHIFRRLDSGMQMRTCGEMVKNLQNKLTARNAPIGKCDGQNRDRVVQWKVRVENPGASPRLPSLMADSGVTDAKSCVR